MSPAPLALKSFLGEIQLAVVACRNSRPLRNACVGIFVEMATAFSKPPTLICALPFVHARKSAFKTGSNNHWVKRRFIRARTPTNEDA